MHFLLAKDKETSNETIWAQATEKKFLLDIVTSMEGKKTRWLYRVVEDKEGRFYRTSGQEPVWMLGEKKKVNLE